LAADTKLPYGSVVDLVVSGGVGAGEFSMPNLLGLSLDQLALLLAETNLVTGVVDLPNQDTTGARVYRQDPTAGASVRAGESVDLWLEKK
jgi:beta-lactam-binding protein with PASTA domain